MLANDTNVVLLQGFTVEQLGHFDRTQAAAVTPEQYSSLDDSQKQVVRDRLGNAVGDVGEPGTDPDGDGGESSEFGDTFTITALN